MAKGGLLLRRIRAQLMSIPTSFGWFVDGKIAASGFPASNKQLRWISSQGIKTVITLTEYPISKELAKGIQMEFIHIPMSDNMPPPPDKLLKAAEEIQERFDKGNSVLVHCLAGMGRTGCVLASWLILRGMRACDAIASVRKLRPGSIKANQEESLYLLEQLLYKYKLKKVNSELNF